jgi:PhnB protein
MLLCDRAGREMNGAFVRVRPDCAPVWKIPYSDHGKGRCRMSKTVKPVPEGLHPVTPYIVVTPAVEAIEFYKKAFGAVEVCRMPGPDGKTVMHAEIKIEGSSIFLGDQFPGMNQSPKSLGGTTFSIMVYTPDVDATFGQAVAAGAKGDMPPADTFWGDRYAKLTDPFGHNWAIATHIEDVTPEEMGRRAEEAFSKMSEPCPG